MHSPRMNHVPLRRSFDQMSSSTPLDKGSHGLDHAVDDTSSSTSANNFNPRKYQLQVFEVAKKRNTIAVLETGAGKTMIAVMLIKDIAQTIKSNGHRKLIIFLAPTVHLVHQQYDVIKINTDCKVEEYYGSKGVDEWTLDCWEKEYDQNDVLVMTPQILLDVLRKAFLRLEMVCFIIIDECHHATKNHPYARVMKEFYHKSNSKPKVFGMTASPVVRKGVSSAMDCEGQISELESILDSQVYTIGDRTEMEVYVPSAVGSCRFYDQSSFDSLDLTEKLEISCSKFDASLSKLQGSVQNSYKDMDDKHKTLRKQLSNYHAKILYCLDELGLICAYEAVKVCLENVPKVQDECEIYRESSLQCKYFLEEILCIIGGSLPLGEKNFLDFGFDYTKAVDLGYISPKLHELLQLFLSFGGATQVLCLIFVERIIAAKVVERFVKKVNCLAHFTVSYLTGSNTSVDSLAPKMQKEILESFRSGKVNLLFATDVVEEGIHVPNCSCVIRFDLPKTVRSYVQSRGRARQNNSQFILMLERGNIKQRDRLFDVIRSEQSMADTTVSRDPDSCVLKACTLGTMNAYVVDITGASVTADSSVSLIHRYCEKLPSDKYYTPKPIFKYKSFDESYECEMTLPSNAPFQTIVGPPSRNKNLSKQLVCLEACKKLHQMGALNDHLLPFIEEPFESNLIVKKNPGAGTTKRKELHGTNPIRALSGSWGEKVDGVVLHAYKFDFSCNIASEIYSGFMFLTESKLDDDVGNFELELYLVSKVVKATVSSCGKVHLDAEQMTKAKCFQEFFFNGLFGRLFVKSKSSGKNREFLLQRETKSLWNPSNMYLLLPLEILGISGMESWRINWTGINACAAVVESLKENSYLGANHSNGYEGNLSPHRTDSSQKECNIEDIIHFANCSVDAKDLKNRVVLAIHTGRIYSTVEVVCNTSAESPFDGTADGAPSVYTTFTDYFRKKYGIVLKHPGQPLLRLKQSHNAHNLLVNFNEEGGSGKASQAKKAQIHIHMPSELLITVDVPINVIKSFYLLPSLMQRLESLMLASQLRDEIDCSSLHIPSSLILEALTTLRCCEKFSMERLELLGDSVLKYAISCHLFLTYPKKHEGQLSGRRQSVICNSTLHKFGTDRKLQGYIRDSAFDARRWAAPGQLSVFPVPCECGVDTLEVPLEGDFFTDDTKVVVGKLCDKGHRWMGSKTISDCVEALIGAYYVGGGLVAALHVMKWLGIDANIEPSLIVEAITCASIRSYVPKTNEIKDIENKVGYEFSVKFLLQEAITHASVNEFYCYQRLEFLGDAVLDLLITWHLYQSHRDIDPGELTDLRSASVNNENFAQVAVRNNLYKHLQHSSTLLLSQITEYVKSFPELSDTISSGPTTKAPKALGDLVESIVGAILIDSKLNLDEVWRICKPLLSPIVTPDKLELPPLRELNELCDSLGYFINTKCAHKGEMVQAELRLQLEDTLLVGQGLERSAKAAKGNAASQLLKQLETRGIRKGVSKTRRLSPDHCDDSSCLHLDNKVSGQTSDEYLPEQAACKKLKGSEIQNPVCDSSKKACSSTNATPIIAPINMKKGGPRTSLFQLCKTMLWPMPTFDTTEHKSRTPMIFDEISGKREGFNSFISKITLHIPGSGNIECTGDPRADKKSSFDSAALLMLNSFEREGKIIISDS
ncbi:endoribonuclease Dicer homolog 3-like [Mangifera indica]|uniref:endoribonuclease Dicer homolog 3-like n=1 Tax=Mangifera indica TaxID=29780 RepID=UPI001CFA5E61|nr:endoribonuclease Dicer homolog 3-like [Mangifera indica]